jgi:hypothetical protein
MEGNKMNIKLNTYGTLKVEEVTPEEPNNYGAMIRADGMEFYIFKSHEEAGQATAQHWRDMAESDPSEFACIVGEQTLVAWALNQYAGPGSVSVRNLEEWLELTADYPQEQWALYDGEEVIVERIGHLLIELEWEDMIDSVLDGTAEIVAYRWN